MLESRGGFRAVVLGMITLGIVSSVMGASARQDKTGAGLKVAIFDAFKLRSESKFAQETERDLQRKQDDANLMLQTWKNNNFLPTQEQKRLGELTVESRTAGANFAADKSAEKKRLEDQSRSLVEEVTKLQTNQTPSPADTERIKVLSRAQSDTEARIQTEQQRLRGEFERQSADATNKLLVSMREAVGKVAKEKGYALVLSNEVAWYADADITDAALSAMNKK